MATTSMSYDHPVYVTPYVFSGSTAVGANGVTTKFGAFTAMKIMAVNVASNTASTSSSTPLMYTKSGTATSTSTLAAYGSAATTSANNVLSTPVTLAQGDQFWVTHGTDATVSLSVAIETRVIPGSTVTSV